MNQFYIDQTRQNDKKSIREIMLKIITLENFKESVSNFKESSYGLLTAEEVMVKIHFIKRTKVKKPD